MPWEACVSDQEDAGFILSFVLEVCQQPRPVDGVICDLSTNTLQRAVPCQSIWDTLVRILRSYCLIACMYCSFVIESTFSSIV